jgi:drug/metabolite transporter (DMT)-like permease
VSIGVADFLGGSVSARVDIRAVLLGQQLSGVIALLLLAPLIHPGLPEARVVVVSAGIGVVGLVGLGAFYRALSRGGMGIVAAVAGLGEVAIPVTFGILTTGQLLPAMQMLGVLAAIGAAISVGTMDSGQVDRQSVALAVLAAGAFGLWFVLLNLEGVGQPFWVIVISRAVTTGLVAATILYRPIAFSSISRGLWAQIVVAGLLDLLGTAFFLLAFRQMQVGLVAALMSLYPVVTMLLAWMVLGQRLPRRGAVSVGLSWAGIVLIATGGS